MSAHGEVPSNFEPVRGQCRFAPRAISHLPPPLAANSAEPRALMKNFHTKGNPERDEDEDGEGDGVSGGDGDGGGADGQKKH